MTSKIKILCIEDEEPVRNSLKDLLVNSGYEVYLSENGLDGINLINLIIPDLVVCDIMLPGLNGYQILEDIQKNEKTRLIPFIFLSAKVGMKNLRIGMDCGADDYIEKPFRAVDLLNSISARLIKKNHHTKNTSSENNFTNDPDSIIITSKSNPEIIKLKNIKFIKANGGYSNIILADNKKIIHRKILKEWSKILDPNIFLRIHRSTIININYIRKVEKFDHRTYSLLLENYQEPFKISQRYSADIKSKFFV